MSLHLENSPEPQTGRGGDAKEVLRMATGRSQFFFYQNRLLFSSWIPEQRQWSCLTAFYTEKTVNLLMATFQGHTLIARIAINFNPVSICGEHPIQCDWIFPD